MSHFENTEFHIADYSSKNNDFYRAQELCETRGGSLGSLFLINAVKQHWNKQKMIYEQY